MSAFFTSKSLFKNIMTFLQMGLSLCSVNFLLTSVSINGVAFMFAYLASFPANSGKYGFHLL